MSVGDELREDHRRSGPRSRMQSILDSMTETERNEWLNALRDKAVSSASVWRKFQKMGYQVSRCSIQDFRLHALKDWK